MPERYRVLVAVRRLSASGRESARPALAGRGHAGGLIRVRYQLARNGSWSSRRRRQRSGTSRSRRSWQDAGRAPARLAPTRATRTSCSPVAGTPLAVGTSCGAASKLALRKRPVFRISLARPPAHRRVALIERGRASVTSPGCSAKLARDHEAIYAHEFARVEHEERYRERWEQAFGEVLR